MGAAETHVHPQRALGRWRARWALLVLVAAMGVHEARYAIFPPEHEAGGHGYLALLIPALTAAVVIGLAEFVHLVIRTRGDGELHPVMPRPRSAVLWARTALTLLAVYLIQESGEALTAGGHAHELFGVLGHGSWVVLPLAAAAALFITLLVRGAVAAVRWAARRAAPPAGRSSSIVRRPSPVPAQRSNVMARRLAGRAPPLAAAVHVSAV